MLVSFVCVNAYNVRNNSIVEREKLHVYSPLAIPNPQSKLSKKVNNVLLKYQIQQQIRRQALSNPIIWSSLPNAIEVILQIPHRKLIYYVGDDYSRMPDVNAAQIKAAEAKMSEHADIILVASQQLAANFPADKTQILNPGVDFQHFATALARPSDLPSGKPIMGFAGLFAQWVDLELINQLAAALPHWHLVLIGPKHLTIELPSAPNIFYLGAKTYQELPAYIQHWNVSLLPFKNNALVAACNPLKFLEYFAVGQPVVSSDLPVARQHSEYLAIAQSPTEFAQQIELALHETDSHKQQRQAFARKNSWLARAAQIKGLISCKNTSQ